MRLTKRVLAGVLGMAALQDGTLLAEPPKAPPRELVGKTFLERAIESNSHLQREDPRELPMKIRSLLKDDYTFFRGTADEFYRECGVSCSDWLSDRAGWITLHGDVHIGNTGTFRTDAAHEKELRFGVVDLDEAVEGPFQLDLLRGLTTIRVAAAAVGRTLDEPGSLGAAESLCEGYRRCLKGETTYEAMIEKQPLIAAILKRAAKNDAVKFVKRYATLEPVPRFRRARIKDGEVKDLLEPVEATERARIVDAVWEYMRDESTQHVRNAFRFANADELRAAIQDVARWTRIGSSGSQGVHKFLVLMDRPLKNDTDPLILELKQQPRPAASRMGVLAAVEGSDRATQVAEAYARLLPVPPRLVGHTRIGERGFLVRTKDPWAEELEAEDFALGGSKDAVLKMSTVLGETLGLAHRQSLIQAKRVEAIELIVQRMMGIELELTKRSARVESRLRDEFEQLRNDSTAKDLVAKAEQFIRLHTGSNP